LWLFFQRQKVPQITKTRRKEGHPSIFQLISANGRANWQIMPRAERLDACPPVAGTGSIAPCDYPGNRAAEGAGKESIMSSGGEGAGNEYDRTCEKM
jgi:hypothetical protein